MTSISQRDAAPDQVIESARYLRVITATLTTCPGTQAKWNCWKTATAQTMATFFRRITKLKQLSTTTKNIQVSKSIRLLKFLMNWQNKNWSSSYNITTMTAAFQDLNTKRWKKDVVAKRKPKQNRKRKWINIKRNNLKRIQTISLKKLGDPKMNLLQQ